MPKQKTSAKKSMPKKSSVRKNKILPQVSSDNICGQLNDWAHAGTEDSLRKLEDFIIIEKNKDLREYARIAYDEANYFYYAPNDDKEEREFILARLIKEREEYFWDLMSEADKLKEEIREFEIKKSVHNRLMKKKLPKNILDDWKYNCSDDFIIYERNRLYEIEQEQTDEEEKGEVITKKKMKAWAVVLDKSVAYPTSGGQLHDTGTINTIPFIDVMKVGASIVHILAEAPSFQEQDTVTIAIDLDRRIQLTQHHSATHIINAAARQLLGSHINQAGAKKGMDKAHLDITHFESLTEAQMDEVEKIANQIVQKKVHSKNRFMSRAEAEKQYGMRLYQGGAVPGTQIRVVEIPEIEVEACGGTHLNDTSETGQIKLIKSQKIQDGIVRLTFTAGKATEKQLENNQQVMSQIGKILGVDNTHLVARANELLEKWRGLQKAKASGKFTPEMLSLTTNVEDPPNSLRELGHLFDAPVELLIPKIQKLFEEWQALKDEIFFD